MTACPCCGFDGETADLKAIAKMLRLAGLEAGIFRALSLRFGETVSADDLVDACYRGVKDGGPENARICIAVAAHRLRPKVKVFGLKIEGVIGKHGGRRLVWDRGASRP